MTTVAIREQPVPTAAIQQDFILDVRSVTKAFGGNRAVDDCSFSVYRGTITGLIGPNGAGKSTLLNVIAGVLQATSGSILLDGEPIDGLRSDKKQESGSGTPGFGPGRSSGRKTRSSIRRSGCWPMSISCI
ncbi:MAG: transporter related protein [Thermomicrobiales bacterium]|nr:transporter related protein [Thermomicrobiales bacterium]